ERAANDPSNPIKFDAEVNEYYLRAGQSDAHARYVIRFCPWCGEDAPVSHRDRLFEVITPEETIRVTQLWKGLRTREDVLKAWGPPDEHFPHGFGETEKEEDGKATRTVYYDLMRYNNLSPTAVVDVILCAGERVMFSYSTKSKVK
ncbi:MAG TPA: hypothetical protein VGF58_00810, partial [Burkholderiales bacterium]